MAQCAGRPYLLLQTKSPLTFLSALADPNNTTWNFCPSIGAAYLFTVLFALISCGHVAQAIIYRKGYSWVIIVAALLQTVNYIFRVLSIKNPTNNSDAIVWFILILVRVGGVENRLYETELKGNRLHLYGPMHMFTWLWDAWSIILPQRPD